MKFRLIFSMLCLIMCAFTLGVCVYAILITDLGVFSLGLLGLISFLLVFVVYYPYLMLENEETTKS